MLGLGLHQWDTSKEWAFHLLWTSISNMWVNNLPQLPCRSADRIVRSVDCRPLYYESRGIFTFHIFTYLPIVLFSTAIRENAREM